ncbi:hypothetical protein GCM10023082_20350 [Streptomyces tremellae]|uniref:Uncharacterized protein n=1 Tax=Streptomyces tremellae TaxID=1124239 RepID=A0ABP7EPN7_9ACTN
MGGMPFTSRIRAWLSRTLAPEIATDTGGPVRLGLISRRLHADQQDPDATATRNSDELLAHGGRRSLRRAGQAGRLRPALSGNPQPPSGLCRVHHQGGHACRRAPRTVRPPPAGPAEEDCAELAALVRRIP